MCPEVPKVALPIHSKIECGIEDSQSVERRFRPVMGPGLAAAGTIGSQVMTGRARELSVGGQAMVTEQTLSKCQLPRLGRGGRGNGGYRFLAGQRLRARRLGTGSLRSRSNRQQ